MYNEEEIYRKKEREYRLLDAKRHFEDYEQALGSYILLEKDERLQLLNDLVDLFEKHKDCSIAENDTWEAAIKQLLEKKPDYKREDESRKYTVTIIETLAKDVVITAKSREEAEELAEENYYNCKDEYILGGDCFLSVDFQAVRKEE